MKGYWVSVYEKVADPEIQKKYAEKASLAIKKYEGKILVRAGKDTSLEGSSSPRTVIVEFESCDVALDCYNSNEYQEAFSVLKGNAKRNFQIVEGV